MDNFVKGFLRQPLTRQSRRRRRPYPLRCAGDGDRESRATRSRCAYQDGNSARTLTADYCISTIPMPIFVTLKTNLPDAVMEAAANLPAQAAGKVGWQAERFWETNDNIYGGISWTDDAIDQIWYPSSGYLSAKGTLTGAYMRGEPAEEFNARTVAERLRMAREQGDKLHPAAIRQVRRARRRHRLEQHGVRADGLGQRKRSEIRRERTGARASRRAASTWPAIRSRSGPAGRKARSLPPIRRSRRSTSRTIRRLGAVEAAPPQSGSVNCRLMRAAQALKRG